MTHFLSVLPFFPLMPMSSSNLASLKDWLPALIQVYFSSALAWEKGYLSPNHTAKLQSSSWIGLAQEMWLPWTNHWQGYGMTKELQKQNGCWEAANRWIGITTQMPLSRFSFLLLFPYICYINFLLFIASLSAFPLTWWGNLAIHRPCSSDCQRE